MEWAYVAGYFDGEGHVSFHDTKRGDKSKGLVWYNNHRASLEAIREFIGAGYIMQRKQRPHQRLPVCMLHIGKKAEILHAIDGMLPHLIIKRDAALRLRDHLVNNVSDKRSENMGKLAAIPVEQLAKWYYEERLSQTQIGKRVGVSAGAVSLLMRRRGLQPRTNAESSTKGIPKSAEHKAKIGEAKRKQWQDPAFREKCVAAMYEGKAKAGLIRHPRAR